MHLIYVSQRLLGGQAHGSFHTVKQEANHLLRGMKVSLALGQFFPRDGLFPAAVVGNRWGWEQGMNSMNGCLVDCQDVCAVCRLGRGVAEVIDIYLQEFSRGVSATLEWDLRDFHQGSTGSLGRGTSLLTKCWVRSRANSVTAQKNPGLSTHPICTAAGMTRQIGSPAA